MDKKSNEETWYVVKSHSRRYSAHVFNDYKQASTFAKSVKSPCKRCYTREESVNYAGCRESKIFFHEAPSLHGKICLVCEKPFKGKTKLCPTCNKLRGTMSVTTAVLLKSVFPDDDIFKLHENQPDIESVVARQIPKGAHAAIRTSRQTTLNSTEHMGSPYHKSDTHIPSYIARLFETDKTKELLYLEGDKLNPYVYYTCKKCGFDQCQQYHRLKVGAGHNCEAEKSSGEVVVEEHLKSRGVLFKSQYDTLRCVNPKTKKIMPYDFELPKHHIIIEVQGRQHLEYIPYFHGSEENFHYQLWRDNYKKTFATQKGYSVFYITYQDIQTGRYKSLIDEMLAMNSVIQSEV